MEENDLPSTLCQKITMIFVAISNNISFFIVLSSAQRIISRYNQPGFLPAIDLALSFSGLFAGSVNTALTQRNVSYDIRFLSIVILMGLGYIGCAFAPQFWMCLISVFLLGASCFFGESVIIGYMAYIKKSSMMKSWGIGTGVSGIIGSLLTIMFIDIEFSYTLSFLCFLPFVAIMAVSYFCVLREKPPTLDTKPLISDNTQTITENEDKLSSCSPDFLRKVVYYFLTYDITYFAQDVIATTFLDCAQTQEYHSTHKYIFPLLMLFENIGILIFCTSLSFFQFPHLKYLTAFQTLNFFAWMLQGIYHWMPIWYEFLSIFIVGSIAGLTYANTFHMILIDNNLSAREKELGSNVTTLSSTVAIIFDTMFGIIAEKTFLSSSVPRS